MDFYQKIIDDLRKKFEGRDDIYALLLTGSVARAEAHEGNDLDIILVAKDKISFEEYREGKSLIEVGGDTLITLLDQLEKNPMFSYMYLDAKAIFDKGNNLKQLKSKAEDVINNYSPSEENKKALIKWLTSVVDKVEVARKINDLEKVGFHISNVLWKITEGFYMINSKPVPASTSALRRIKNLEKIPNNFDIIWKNVLLGNLEERTDGTLELIKFVLSNLD